MEKKLNFKKKSKLWIGEENLLANKNRIERLIWLQSITPLNDYWGFSGELTKPLFEEARYSFVLGQFLGTILLGIAYVEKTIAGRLYSIGDNKVRESNFNDLLSKAVELKYITIIEKEKINKYRKIRNKITHFRILPDKDLYTIESVSTGKHLYEIIEEDARNVILIMMSVVQKNVI